MKKFLVVTILFLFAGTVFGQTFDKDALICIHTLSITLEEDVTMDQYLEFIADKFFPEYEKTFSCDARLVKGLNRDIEGKIGVLINFKSKQEWSKYWNDDGSFTDTGQAEYEKLRPILDEMKKLGTWSSENVVDWVIQ